MVESRRRIPTKQQINSPEPPQSILEKTDYNAKQKKALAIIKGLSLDAEQMELLFLFHLFREEGMNPVKKLTGIKNSFDARRIIGQVIDSDDLTAQYDIFYQRYNLEELEGE